MSEKVISDRSGSTGCTTGYTDDSQGNKLTETNALYQIHQQMKQMLALIPSPAPDGSRELEFKVPRPLG